MKLLGLMLVAVSCFVTASPAQAAWDFKVLEDPMTDAKRGISLLLGDQGGLAIKCDKNGAGSLYLSVISKSYLGSVAGRRTRSIQYRIDKGEPQQIDAFYDGSMASVFDLTPGSAGGQLLKQITTAKQLVVDVTSYDYRSHIIVFDTAGAGEAVNKSATACGDTGWSSP